MKFNCKLIESNSFITKNILDILASKITQILKNSVVPIESKIKILIKESLTNQPEYLSLVGSNGSLRLNFGIADSTIVDSAIERFCSASSFNITPIKTGNLGLSGGFTLSFLPSSEIESAALSSAILTEKGQSLPWLSWLLFEGTSPIVRNYDIKYGYSPNSRTGGAIMIPGTRNWRVPGEYAGTIRNNWITRSIEDIDDEIYSIIQTTIRNNI